MITLDTELLEFDITGILGSEINQHIDFYNDGVNEAYMAIKIMIRVLHYLFYEH